MTQRCFELRSDVADLRQQEGFFPVHHKSPTKPKEPANRRKKEEEEYHLAGSLINQNPTQQSHNTTTAQ